MNSFFLKGQILFNDEFSLRALYLSETAPGYTCLQWFICMHVLMNVSVKAFFDWQIFDPA